MSKAILFLVNGFEETEAIVPTDILRRGGVDIKTASLTGDLNVEGKHGIMVKADILFKDIAAFNPDILIIPGGTVAYLNYPELLDLVVEFNSQKKLLAAICAAPAVFGKAGLLNGRKAVIYPGMGQYLGEGAVFTDENVVVDGNIITGKGPGVSMLFAIKLLEILKGKETAQKVKKDFILQQ